MQGCSRPACLSARLLLGARRAWTRRALAASGWRRDGGPGVPPEAAKKHVGAPLSPENVTIVKFRQNLALILQLTSRTLYTYRALLAARFRRLSQQDVERQVDYSPDPPLREPEPWG